MTKTSAQLPEFSRPVQLADLETAPQTLTFTATEAECATLAERFGVLGVTSLTATVTLRAASAGATADLSLTAGVDQKSVISLEPVQEQVAEEWQVRYLPPRMVPEAEDAAAVDVDTQEDDIEVIEGETIDIGETIAQQLSVALNPYPRGGDERLEDHWQNDAEEETGEHPFDVLKTLRQNT